MEMEQSKGVFNLIITFMIHILATLQLSKTAVNVDYKLIRIFIFMTVEESL